MQTALRPYATAGVALVGASVIAVSPVTVTPTAVEEARETSVQLSALMNPIELLGPIFQRALENAQTVGGAIAADPAPIVEQILRNQLSNLASLPEAIQTQIGVLPELPELLGQAIGHEIGNVQSLGGISQTFLQNVVEVITGGVLQRQIEDTVQEIRDGDFGTAFNNLIVLTPLVLIAGGDQLQNLGLILPLVEALQQPFADAAALFPIAAGPLTNAQAAIGQLPIAVGLLTLGALSPVSSTAIAAGDTLGGLLDAARNGDLEGAFNAVVTGVAAATDGILTNTLDPTSGIVAGLQSLREAIAAAITQQSALSEVAKVPSAAAQSFTLTAPLEKASDQKTAATPVDEKATPDSVGTGTGTGAAADPSGESTSTNAADAAKGGNLFTPGSTATKGGSHRADTGPSFAQNLKDAAEKTIKGITGLNRDKNSAGSTAGAATTGTGNGSASPGSGNAGSGASSK